MSKKTEDFSSAAPEPRSGDLPIYRAPWKGQLLLACRKCRKKLRKSSAPAEAAHLKKLLKGYGKRSGGEFRLRVIEVPCLKLCPKGGVTVCTQQQLGRAECSIVRTRRDVDALYAQAQADMAARIDGDHSPC